MALENIRQAARWDLLLQQGSSFRRTLSFDTDVSAVQFRGQIRRSHQDSTVLAEFLFEVINSTQLSISLTAAQTAALPAERLVHDIEAFAAGEVFVSRIIEGKIKVTPEVTR